MSSTRRVVKIAERYNKKIHVLHVTTKEEVDFLAMHKKNVTFETNTTQELRDDFRDYIGSKARFHTTWSCSPKLTVSGELWSDAIKPEIANSYFTVPDTHLYLKFVVADEVDVDEVTKAVEEYKSAGVECPVYCMAVGGCYEEYQENAKTVANLAMGRGWRYTPRLHVDIFGNSWGT